MQRIPNKNTKPELFVRSLLHRNGYRFRLHSKHLSGKPDIVLPKYKTVVFVNGCFWHLHKNCPDASIPKTRTEFWRKKLKGNFDRDQRNHRKLRDEGWKVVVVWECEISFGEALLAKLNRELQLST